MTSETAEPSLPDEKVRELLGRDFIVFVLNGVGWTEVSSTDEPRQRVKLELRNILGTAVANANDDHSLRGILIRLLADRTDEQIPLIQRWRRGCAASEPVVQSDDPLVNALSALLMHCFPFDLLPPLLHEPRGVAPYLSYLRSDPLLRTFMEKTLEDRHLGALFPRAHAIQRSGGPAALRMRESTHAFWSHGSPGPLELASVPFSALEFTLNSMRLADEFDIWRIEKHAAATVSTMRELAGDRVSTVPTVACLTNVNLQQDAEVRLAGASLIPASRLKGVHPGVAEGTSALLVLDTELRLLESIAIEDFAGPGEAIFNERWESHVPAFNAARQKLTRDILKSQLAVLLSSGVDDFVSPSVRTVFTEHPLAGRGRTWSTSRVESPRSVITLSPVRAKEVEVWSDRTKNHPESMLLGAKRLVSATSARLDPLDALIDAVTCWENMVGSESAVSFRVCAALSGSSELSVVDLFAVAGVA